MNIIVNGSLNMNNLSWFVFYCLIYFTFQTIVVLTFQYCLLANVNAGIVSTIWSITPLFAAKFDYLLFGESLTRKHLIGLVCLVLCVGCISIGGVIDFRPASES